MGAVHADLCEVDEPNAALFSDADLRISGYVALMGGALRITAGGDGISAATDLVATGGEVVVVAGGGSGAVSSADVSTKGLKVGVRLAIDGGSFAVNASGDGLHSAAER
jgi:hypothetical protein